MGLVRDVGEERTTNESERHFLKNLADHIEDEIVGDATVKAAVLDLWRRHPRAMRLAVQHRPRLDDIKDEFLRHLRDRLPGTDQWEFKTYPNRGPIREIKATQMEWVRRGMPITFILYSTLTEPPSVHLAVWEEWWPANHDRLEGWARAVREEHVAGDLGVDCYWRRWGPWHVLLRRDLDADVEDLDGVCDPATAVEAARQIGAWYGAIRSSVEAAFDGSAGRG